MSADPVEDWAKLGQSSVSVADVVYGQAAATLRGRAPAEKTAAACVFSIRVIQELMETHELMEQDLRDAVYRVRSRG